MLLPYYQVVMSKGRFLASDGRSKTFEAGADGYGRGEGSGVSASQLLSYTVLIRIPRGPKAEVDVGLILIADRACIRLQSMMEL